jgi:hypothetical protein
MSAITEIIWPLFRRDQLYDQDIPEEKLTLEKLAFVKKMPWLYNFQQNLVVEQLNGKCYR